MQKLLIAVIALLSLVPFTASAQSTPADNPFECFVIDAYELEEQEVIYALGALQEYVENHCGAELTVHMQSGEIVGHIVPPNLSDGTAEGVIISMLRGIPGIKIGRDADDPMGTLLIQDDGPTPLLPTLVAQVPPLEERIVAIEARYPNIPTSVPSAEAQAG